MWSRGAYRSVQWPVVLTGSR
uniref:Uncharacterized protein n=1 Tax=Arundo donax TaxID=35708 RepID=A0A0A8YNF7_ARUDO